MAGSETVREVELFYRGYMDAFNRQDVDSHAQWLTMPYALISAGGLTVCVRTADHRWLSNEVFRSLKARGWSHSEIDKLNVWPLADDQALIMADVTRRKSDGSILETGRFGSIVIQSGERWRIVLKLQQGGAAMKLSGAASSARPGSKTRI